MPQSVSVFSILLHSLSFLIYIITLVISTPAKNYFKVSFYLQDIFYVAKNDGAPLKLGQVAKELNTQEVTK